MSDESLTLVDRWRDGDDFAATELYERYFERLMRVVSSHLLGRYQKRVEPEDVLQSAFRTVFRRISEGEFRFEDDADIWKLLVTVVLNKLRNQVRHMNAGRRDIRREAFGDSDFDGHLASQLSQPPHIEVAVEFAELMQDIFPLLPENERTLLQLRLEGYTQKEIAERMDVTDRTIRRLWERVRQRIIDIVEIKNI
jgi:RNA polymerase sigma-70 factor (ECF subfamily)